MAILLVGRQPDAAAAARRCTALLPARRAVALARHGPSPPPPYCCPYPCPYCTLTPSLPSRWRRCSSWSASRRSPTRSAPPPRPARAGLTAAGALSFSRRRGPFHTKRFFHCPAWLPAAPAHSAHAPPARRAQGPICDLMWSDPDDRVGCALPRLIPPFPPVLTGHASSLPPVRTGHASSLPPVLSGHERRAPTP